MITFSKFELLSVLSIIFILGMTLGAFINHNSTPVVDLPEQWHLITEETPLAGHITSDGVLHLEFDNR